MKSGLYSSGTFIFVIFVTLAFFLQRIIDGKVFNAILLLEPFNQWLGICSIRTLFLIFHLFQGNVFLTHFPLFPPCWVHKMNQSINEKELILFGFTALIFVLFCFVFLFFSVIYMCQKEWHCTVYESSQTYWWNTTWLPDMLIFKVLLNRTI